MDKQAIRLPLAKEILSLLSRDDEFSAEVKSINIYQDELYCESIVLDYRIIELCQKPVNDIRKIEPVEICIYEDQMPDVIALRQDFPVLPHVMIFLDDEHKYLCVIDEPYEEVKYKLSGRLILECLDRWFVLSARGELHKPNQPLDPFFPSVKDNIIITGIPSEYNIELFSKMDNNGAQTLVQISNSLSYTSCEYYPIVPLILKKSSTNIIQKLPKTLYELSNIFPTQNILEQFRNRLKELVRIKTDPKAFSKYFNQAPNVFRKSKCIIFLIVPLVREKSQKTEREDIKAILINQPLSAIFKDLGMIEEKSKLLHNSNSLCNGKNLNLQFFNVHHHYTENLAQFCSGVHNTPDYDMNIIQIGVGAIGSQIYENCLRAGYGNWMLLDDDTLFPHNLARHALDRRFIGFNKAMSMKIYAKSILMDARVLCSDENILRPVNKAALEDNLNLAQIIIDTSASPAVERHLALDIVSPAQRISFFMNPKGDSAVMLLEDVGRKATLDLLEMQYYKILSKKDRYDNYFDTPGEIVYSTTCRSVSSQIPQDNVSLFSALCSKALKKHALSESAKIIIWTFDGESVFADVTECCDYEERTSGNWHVMISKEVVSSMYLERKYKFPKETGSVLIGSYDYSRKILYIVDMIKSPSDSIESPTSYIRGCHGLLTQVKSISKRSAGFLNYIGEWHSHPSDNTTMSSDDKLLFSSIIQWNAANGLPGCMVITGTDNYAVYVSGEMIK